MQFDIEINGEQVTAKKGETIKNVLDRIGIKVPTLCNMNGFTPTGSCRLCVVEVDGLQGLVPSCSHQVEEWMKIKTHSPRVLKARKTIVELLLARHPDECLYCNRNKNCELQSLAEELDIRERKHQTKRLSIQIDRACSSIERDPAKCILCGRCIRICDEVIGVAAIDIMGRGSDSRIGTSYNKGLNVSSCVKCGQCIMVCPTAALSERSNIQTVLDALHNPELFPVIQFSPTVPASIAEDFNLKTSKDILNLFRAALKKMGFRQIFDTSMAADLTIMEEAAEFIDRWNKQSVLPMFTSCCPSWVRYAEEEKRKLLPNLSSTRSPQQMMGRVVKNYITSSAGQKPSSVFVVSVMPCTSKKHEAEGDVMKDNNTRYVDAVLTTRELVRLIRLMGIDFSCLEPEPNDTAFSLRSSAGKLFGVSGGHLEGLIRTIHYMMTGQEINPIKINDLRGLKTKKETHIKIGKQVLKVMAVSGLANVKSVLDEIESGRKDVHIVEVMTCPFGCINGGGQRIGSDEKSLKSRMKAIYDVDEEEMIKVAHKNPIITDLYDKFLGHPNSDQNKDLLHQVPIIEKTV
ncbi:MAG: [FeFe] hydrogenase, group A [Bacteroidales bacterium]|nr:[FeFe] hydrogenase, group A [Bacteroidales bacterium]